MCTHSVNASSSASSVRHSLISGATIMREGLVVSAYDPPFICLSRFVLRCARTAALAKPWLWAFPVARLCTQTLLNRLRGKVPDGRAAFELQVLGQTTHRDAPHSLCIIRWSELVKASS